MTIIFLGMLEAKLNNSLQTVTEFFLSQLKF